MSNPDPEAPSQPETETVEAPDEHDRELLDYLIERAWQELLRRLPQTSANDNRKTKRAA